MSSKTPAKVDQNNKSARILNDPVYIGDLPVRLGKTSTDHGGYRYRFICPNCGLRVAKLCCSEDITGCRHCMSARYPSSRYKGMTEEKLFKQAGGNTHA